MQAQGFTKDALRASAVVATLVALIGPGSAAAEPYLGAGFGRASTEVGDFDENDSATKLIAGYIFDLPAVDFSVEANYVDFGTPRDEAVGVEITGLDAFALVGADFGLVGIFAKAGIIAWDMKALPPAPALSVDGTDRAYGAGLRFNLASVEIRGEYELFDVDAVDDLDMLSVSVLWRF